MTNASELPGDTSFVKLKRYLFATPKAITKTFAYILRMYISSIINLKVSKRNPFQVLMQERCAWNYLEGWMVYCILHCIYIVFLSSSQAVFRAFSLKIFQEPPLRALLPIPFTEYEAYFACLRRSLTHLTTLQFLVLLPGSLKGDKI